MSRRWAWWICAEVISLETIDPTFGKGLLLHHSEYYHSRKDPKIKGQSWIKGSSCSAYLLPIWCICTQMAKEQCNILNQGMIFRSRLWHWTAMKKVGEMTHGWISMTIWRQLVQYHFLKDWLLFQTWWHACFWEVWREIASLSTATCNGFQFRSPQLCMKD